MTELQPRSVSTAYAASLIGIAVAMGVSRAQALDAMNITEPGLQDMKRRVSLTDLNAFLDTVEAALPGVNAALELGAKFRVHTFTKTGNVLAFVRTIADAVAVNAKYETLSETIGTCALERRESGDFMTWQANPSRSETGDAQDLETCRRAAELICTGYATTTQWLAWSFDGDLDGAGFRHDPPADTSRYEAVFGCPVEFGSAENFIKFSPGIIDLPLPSFNPGKLERTCAKLDLVMTKMTGKATLRDKVVVEIKRAVKDGSLSEGTIAKTLGMSERGLRRALANEGIGYRAIVDETLQAMCLTYMRDGRSLTEISIILGYNDPPALTRAFKRWLGMTPRAYKSQMK